MGDAGYTFIKHLSVELGGGYLPKTVNDDVYWKQWFLYLEGKVDFNVADNIDLFTKVGIACRDVSMGGEGSGDDKSTSSWQPIFSVGGAYDVGSNLSINAQYTHLASDTSSRDVNLDRRDARELFVYPVDMFTIGLGYQFSM